MNRNETSSATAGRVSHARDKSTWVRRAVWNCLRSPGLAAFAVMLSGNVGGCASDSLEVTDSSSDLELQSADSALTVRGDLVAHYTFETGDASDASGNGHHGVIIGGPSFPLERGGRVVRLDGETQKISIPNASGLFSNSVFSVCAWVKPEILTWPGRIVELGAGGGYSLTLTDAKAVFTLPSPSGDTRGVSNRYVRVREWNHICGTSNGTTAHIYINGVLDTTFPAPRDPYTVQGPLVIGARHDGWPLEHQRGDMDEVAIYSRALSSDEVADIHRDGTLEPAAPLDVQCAVPGELYLNGHATGETCPATLRLPVAGHYWVGLGSDSRGYQHREIVTQGSNPVQLAFEDSGWLPRKDWKVLVYSVRHVRYSNGKLGRLSDESISQAVASARQTNEWVIPDSYGLVGWQVDSFIEEDFVGEVVPDGNNYPFLDPNATLDAAGRIHFKAEYDHIFAYFPAAFATDGSFYGNCCGAATAGQVSHIPDTWGVYGQWREGIGNSQLWYHEWMHGAEWQLGALMGWPLGRHGLHGGETHGFAPDPELVWLPFYRAFMRGQVPEDGAFVGLSPMGFIESTPLSKTLVQRTLEPREHRAVPARLEAEDNDGQSGVRFETSSEGGLNAGWIDSGSYIEWDIAVPAAGNFTVTSRSATTCAASYAIWVNGEPVAAVALPRTGGWQTWRSFTTPVFHLTAGAHKLRLQFTSAGQNLNWIEVGSVGTGEDAPARPRAGGSAPSLKRRGIALPSHHTKRAVRRPAPPR